MVWWMWWLACTCTPPIDPTGGVGSPVPASSPAAVIPEVPPEPFALTSGPVPGFPDFRSSASQALQLHVLPAHAQLPVVRLPQAVDAATDRFALPAEEVPNPRAARRRLVVSRARLPFPLDADASLFRPTGMEVWIDGQRIPFSRAPAPQARASTWRINGEHIVLSHPTVPARGTLEVHYPGVAARIARHDPERAGLDFQEFVRTELTLGRETRSGLLLVAPTVLEWSVTLPEGQARFEGWVAMEPSPLRTPASDGAEFVLEVVEGGVATEIASRDVPGRTPRFEPWRADLSRWAGKAVKLRLASRAGGHNTFDWVFVGSPTVWGPPRGEVRRVVVIGLDTTRPDHLSFNGYHRPTTPEIDAFARSGVVLGNTWAPAPRTRPSFRSATTGRRPLEAVGATNVGAGFREHGFATAGIVANPHLQPHFDFSDGFDWWAFDGRADAEGQVDDALDWLESHAEQDSYLFLHIMDPHMIYDAPGAYRDRFVDDPDPGLPDRMRRGQVLDRMKHGTLTDRQKVQLEALHDGELAYTSAHLGRLIDALDRMPGRTLVVMHTDHGEEFWEHEGFEHNHTLYDEVTRALLVFRPRGGLPMGMRVATPASLVDIGPTLYDLFGIASPPPVDGRTLVPLFQGSSGLQAWAPRPIPIGHLQYAHERWGVVWEGHKYVLHTGSGREELYDLTSDPGERQDLSAERALEPFREQLARAHHMVVGPGWRVRLLGGGWGDAVEIDLPAPAVAAGVLDPESVVEKRANIEWGERPRRVSADVGSVALTSDGRQLVFTPGDQPDGGVLYVIFADAENPASAQVRIAGAPLTASEGALGPRFETKGGAVVLDPGTIVIPPMTEAERMGLVRPPEADDDLMGQLCELGYVEEGCPE